MAGVTGGCDLHDPVGRSGTALLRQLAGVADHADVWFYHGFIIVFKKLDGEGSRVDFAVPFLLVDIICNFLKIKLSISCCILLGADM